jgi:outer membrane protein, heavy metal efflux system
MRAIACAVLVSALPIAAHAEPLTFDAALGAATQAPSLRSGALTIEAQRSASVAAGALPDPKVGVSVENFPISGPPAFSASDDEMTMLKLGVSQEIPNAAKRHARTARALADTGEAQASLVLFARQVRVETALAWIDLAYAQRRLMAIDEAVTRIDGYRGTANASVASGTARPAQSLEVRKAVAVLEDRRSELSAERRRASATLARWTGDPAPEVRGPIPQFAVDRSALLASLDDHPQLAVAGAKVTQAEADIALARAEKRPDWMVDAAYGRRNPRYGDMVTVGVSMSLPLFAKRRQDPVIAARTAASGAALAQQEDQRRALLAELEAGLADHVMHHEQWDRAQSTLLPLARQQSDLETASYAAGRASLVDVIAARTQLVDTELMVLEREAAVARDAARLVLTFGDAK